MQDFLTNFKKIITNYSSNKNKKGNVVIVTGIQWGDEGKGKVSNYLSKDCRMVIRATGGNNAGHTVKVAGQDKFALHLLPGSIINKNVMSVISNGVVVDLEVLCGEIADMHKRGVVITPDNLKISDRIHLIMPWHKTLDAILEDTKANKIGTTKRGIGPCFSEKAQRTGIRMVDLFDKKTLKTKIIEAAKMANIILKAYKYPLINVDQVVLESLKYAKIIKPYLTDTGALIRNGVLSGDLVVIEGAQAMYLDIDHGTYPYVTSSNPVSTGALVGSGIGPKFVREVIGVMKAYTSRVGAGPFPTKLIDATGDKIRELGHEYGTTTGRPRDCGWLDLVMIKNAAFVNGLTSLCINHIDTIGMFSKIKVCIGYQYKGKKISYVPADLENCIPIYKSFKGNFDAKGKKTWNQLSKNAQIYIKFIEEYTGVPVKYIGVGPEDTQTIIK